MERIKTNLQQQLQHINGLFFDVLLNFENCDTPEQADVIDEKIEKLARELADISTNVENIQKSFRVAYANRNVKTTTQRIVDWEVESSIDYQRAGIYKEFVR